MAALLECAADGSRLSVVAVNPRVLIPPGQWFQLTSVPQC